MKNVLIIGAGSFGTSFAEKILELGGEVRLVDADENAIENLPRRYENSVIGDCRNINVVEQIGVRGYDICVVSVGHHFQSSLEITANLKECGAKYIISQCSSDVQAKFLKMAGADKTVYPAKEAAEKVAFLCNEDNLIDYFSVSEEYKVAKVRLPKKWEGHTMPELHLRDRHGINVLAVERDGRVVIPDAAFVFCKDDVVLLMGKKVFKLI